MESLITIISRSIKEQKDKVAFSDENEEESYSLFGDRIKRIGSFLLEHQAKTVCILLNKSIKVVNCMFGCVLARATYIVLDANSPEDRLKKIVDAIHPSILLYEDKTKDLGEKLFNGKTSGLASYSFASEHYVNRILLNKAQEESLPSDLIYILFTSGSTGTPKGVMITQENIISYMGWFVKCFNINSKTVFGNQTPFYFSMSVSDVYSTLFAGATLHIIPQSCFSFPVNLIKYLNEKKINTIYWVPSVFAIIHFFKILDYILPSYLKTVLFAGEVMQMKDLNYFRSKLPDCLYANLFGPTETTDICTYYKVDRSFKDTDSLPIGVSCEGLHCLLLDEKLNECKKDEEGELYVGGKFVSPGYFNKAEKTKETFIKNPLNKSEILYKTGDLCRINEYGEYMFTGRADFQIKHMGYRIELGEIETGLLTEEKVLSALALYDSKEDKIIMIYAGNLKEDKAAEIIKSKVPFYMIPNLIIRTTAMKYNNNGKIDRKWYSSNYQTLLKK